MNYEKGVSYKQLAEDFVTKLKTAYNKKNILTLLLKNFNPEEPVRILEYGPGLGIMADILHETYSSLSYTVVDVEAGILDRIVRRHPDSVTFHIKSADDLRGFLKGKKFDAIIALDVWEHIPSGDLNAYTSSSLAALDGNGVFIAQAPNWGCPFTPNVMFAGDITHCNRFNEVSAKQLLLTNGADVENINILPCHFPQNGLMNLCRSLIRPLLLAVYQVCFFLLGLQVLKVCTPNLIMFVKNNKETPG